MTSKSYTVGKSIKAWRDGKTQTITFVVTDDCNLRCKYCYITHKASNSIMPFETAKKFIDYILTANIKRSEAVVVEFIGGEPFIEVELIDRIADYFKRRSFELGSDWYWNYRLNICTNGVNYSDELVQKFIKKNFGKLSCSITLDGTREKHDTQRVFPDGRGSYETIIKNVRLWVSQFGGSTKVTFASDDLKYLKDSVLELWSNDITEVSANVVFENVWKENDDQIFESQIKELADHIIENNLYNSYYCSLFSESLGGYYHKDDLDKTSCGAGKMIAVGADGNIYPCIRYKGYSLNNKDEWIIGTVDSGINMEKVRPFVTATYKLQSDAECLECPVAGGCSFCQGFNYDEADTPTNFSRAKYICKMHKARVRANNYYFAKLLNRIGIDRESMSNNRRRLYFILAEDFVDYCQYMNTSDQGRCMSRDDILKGLEFSHENFYEPIFIHSKRRGIFETFPEFESHRILHIIPAESYEKLAHLRLRLPVFDKNSIDLPIADIKNCMLNVGQDDLKNLFEYASVLLCKSNRINANIQGLTADFDETVYREQLLRIKDLLIDVYHNTGETREFSLITDLCFITEHNNCKAGERSFALLPDGGLYLCPAYYQAKANNRIGNTSDGITDLKNAHLYKNEYSSLCSICDAYQCPNCVFLNQSATNEVNVSPSFQCRKAYIEREVSRLYREEAKNPDFSNRITKLDADEPINILLKNTGVIDGYYVYGR